MVANCLGQFGDDRVVNAHLRKFFGDAAHVVLTRALYTVLSVKNHACRTLRRLVPEDVRAFVNRNKRFGEITAIKSDGELRKREVFALPFVEIYAYLFRTIVWEFEDDPATNP